MTPAVVDAAASVVLAWLLTYAIHSTILLTLAAVAAWRLADRHAWLDVIWKTALIAPLVTASLHVDPIAVPLGGRWTMPNATAVTGAPIAAPAPAPVVQTAVTPATTAEPVTPAMVADRAAVNETLVRARGARFAPSPWLRAWPAIAAAAWLIVAFAVVVRYGVRLRRVYRALGAGVPVTDPDLLHIVESWRSSTARRRPMPLTTSPICPVPLALAGSRIVLPDRLLRDLDPEQQRAALAHEMAHVIRRDPEWRIAIEILERALFFQPLNRLARVRLCDAAEFLCDEWAVRQVQSPLAMARCLSEVASWWSSAGPGRRSPGEGGKLAAGVSAMARSDSAMVRRVTRILNEPARAERRPRLHWLALPVMVVAVAAPRVTATQFPAAVAVTPAVTPAVGAAPVDASPQALAEQRAWTSAEIASARAQLRVQRSARPADPLEARWRQALADAARQGLNNFWIVYTFTTPVHADEVTISDTNDGSVVWSNGRLSMQGPPLTALFDPASAVPLEGGKLAVLLHYRGARADAIDRAGYRTASLGFDFGRTPVFWLGDAPESQSFAHVQSLFGQARTEKIQSLLIELASMHSNTDVVLPFLTRLVDPSQPAAIRREAAEGFDHHHDPRSVEVLLRVARTDPDSSVRAEAAEAIGEVQTPQSIPALNDLVNQSTDSAVRREAAEAFAGQPAAQALPAIERIIAASQDDEVVSEIIEALGEFDQPRALSLLLQTANTHPNRRAQQEAVETLGDIDAPAVMDALTKIAWEHQDETIQREAVETLGDRHDDAAAMTALGRIAREHHREDVQAEAIETLGEVSSPSIHPVILELALTGKSARTRRAALEAIGEAVGKIGDGQALDRAQQTLERAIFDDPDPGVREEALDALGEFPSERALRVLRDVVARHPDARVRRDAQEHIRERRQ
jgi:HEAT repeat protein/beta-lactamase regulating signal transducer with metallopeptidase domain